MRIAKFIFCAFALASCSTASPIVITSGSIVASFFSEKINLFGEGFALSINTTEPGNIKVINENLAKIGTTLDAFAYFDTGGSFKVPVTYNGITYTDLYWGGLFQLQSPPFTVALGTVTVPFTVTDIRVSASDNPVQGCLICPIQLTGGGIATITYIHNPAGGPNDVETNTITYTFMTPEPATLMFVLSGVAALLLASRRRQGSHGCD